VLIGANEDERDAVVGLAGGGVDVERRNTA
jgi:hypothetical protein